MNETRARQVSLLVTESETRCFCLALGMSGNRKWFGADDVEVPAERCRQRAVSIALASLEVNQPQPAQAPTRFRPLAFVAYVPHDHRHP